ncbi:MAG TPA: hypothetical protein PKX91_00675 [Clostridia bacterium]|jgi:predicted  nucleic acid-binding Zn-ribbon protein|nr:hypothetical protein [Clostridia bacterium]
MNIAKLLEYQEEDQKIIAIEEAIKNSPQSQYLRQINALVNKLYEEGKEAEKKRNELNLMEGSFGTEISDLDEKIQFLQEEIERCETLDQLLPVEKEIGDIEQDANKLEGKIKEIEKLEVIANKHPDIITNWKKACILLTQKKKEFDNNVLTIIKEKITPIKDRMAKIESELLPEDLESYKKTKNNVKTAPFICEYVDGFCSGCNKDVEAEVSRKLQKESTTHCPECQRILYIK